MSIFKNTYLADKNPDYTNIKNNIYKIRNKIEISAKRVNRKPEDITFVCVTKAVGVDSIQKVIDCGIRDIGENRIKDSIEKKKRLGFVDSKIKWHFIGHLQKNKTKDAVQVFDVIHSVDSVALAEKINKYTESLKLAKKDIFIQVNVAGEKSKFGFNPEQILSVVREIKEFENISLKGLMMIAPLVDNSEDVRKYFTALRKLKNEIKNNFADDHNMLEFKALSMGMSQDFEIAIEEGADYVRIGSAVFGI